MKKKKMKSIKGFMPILFITAFVVINISFFIGEIAMLPILSAIDLSLTYAFMKMYRKHNPKDKDWARFEQNGIAKFFWKRLGLAGGTIALLAFAMILWIVMIYFMHRADPTLYSAGIFTGIYIFIISAHIINLRELKNKISDEKTQKKRL